MSETYLCSSEQFTLARVWTTSTYWNSRICWIRRKNRRRPRVDCVTVREARENKKYKIQFPKTSPDPAALANGLRQATDSHASGSWRQLRTHSPSVELEEIYEQPSQKTWGPQFGQWLGGAWILRLNSVDSMPAMIFPQLNWGCGSPSARDVSMFQCMACPQNSHFQHVSVVTKSVMRELCGHLPWQGHGRKYPCFYSLLIISVHALGIWACHFWSILWSPDPQLTLKVTGCCHWQWEQTLCTLSPGPINLWSWFSYAGLMSVFVGSKQMVWNSSASSGPTRSEPGTPRGK